MVTHKNQSDDNSKKGFASMDEVKQKEIASKGGKAAHERGTAHEFDSEKAREAGHKGGKSRSGGNATDNQNDDERKNQTSHSRGGCSQQHAEAGKQSHKNQK